MPVKKPTAPARAGGKKNYSPGSDQPVEQIPADPLIRFNRTSLGIITVLVFLFLILTVGGIHYSSIGHWDRVVSETTEPVKKSKVIAGSPKLIRMDEWRVASSTILSQYIKGYPVENPAIGAGSSPLVMNIPVNHFTAFFMPQHWGFHLLPFGTGFSFLWNYRIFALLISTFLLLMLLTRNRPWLSLSGALVVFFSAFVQWWFSSFIGEYITALNVIVIASIYLFYAQRVSTLILHALLFLLFAVNFVIIPYPPFQVPLFYLALSLFAGLMISRHNAQRIRKHLPLKSTLILVSLVAAGAILFLFYRDIRETMEITFNTAYPGKRISTGGDLGADRFFSGFYQPFFSEKRFIWDNVCENSNFIFLFPVVIAAMVAGFAKKIRDPLQTALGIYLLIMTFFALVGFFPALSRITLFSFVPSFRSFLAPGIASTYLIFAYLADRRRYLPATVAWQTGAGILLLVIFFLFGSYISKNNGDFFSGWETTIISIYFAAASLLLLYKKVIPFTVMLLLITILGTYDVMPVSNGVGFYTEKKLYKAVGEVADTDPGARWAFFNEPGMSSFAIAAGANMVNGTKYIPDIPLMRTLDPEGKNDSIYNRYSNFVLGMIADTGAVRFILLHNDLYVVEVSPLNSRFRKLGVKYLMLPSTPGGYNVEAGKRFGLMPVYGQPVDGFWILRVDSAAAIRLR